VTFFVEVWPKNPASPKAVTEPVLVTIQYRAVSRSRDGYCSLALAGNAAVGLDISKAEDRAAHRLDDIPVVTKRGCDLVRQSCETLALGGYRPHSECPGRARLQVVVGRAPGRGRKDAALARQTWRRCGHGVADDRASSITCRRAPLDAC